MGPITTYDRSGGIKGFLERANKSFQKGFAFSREWSWWLAQKGGSVGLFLASTSMVVLLPLIFEINREAMVRRRNTTRRSDVCIVVVFGSMKLFLILLYFSTK
jgi:hypothetical protein